MATWMKCPGAQEKPKEVLPDGRVRCSKCRHIRFPRSDGKVRTHKAV